MKSTLIAMTFVMLGSLSAKAETSNADLAATFKSDMTASCIENAQLLSTMTNEHVVPSAELCALKTEELYTDNSRGQALSQIFDMIVAMKGNDAALKDTKAKLASMEDVFDGLDISTVIARPAMYKLIDKLLSK